MHHGDDYDIIMRQLDNNTSPQPEEEKQEHHQPPTTSQSLNTDLLMVFHSIKI